MEQRDTAGKLLSPKMLADYLGLAEQTIYNRHATGGDLPASFKLGRLLRFHPADVNAWLAEKKTARTVQPQAAQPARRRPGRPTKAEQIARRTH